MVMTTVKIAQNGYRNVAIDAVRPAKQIDQSI